MSQQRVRSLLAIDNRARRLEANPLEKLLRQVAMREGLLLRFLDDDAEVVSLVERHAGAALATYETLDSTDLLDSY